MIFVNRLRKFCDDLQDPKTRVLNINIKDVDLDVKVIDGFSFQYFFW